MLNFPLSPMRPLIYQKTDDLHDLQGNLRNPKRNPNISAFNSINNRSILKFVQLNVHKCKAATQQLIMMLESENVDVALIQEPYCYKGNLPLYPKSYKIYFDIKSEVIKAAIIIRNTKLHPFLDLNSTHYNMVTIDITVGNLLLTLCSYYFEPCMNIDTDLEKISQMLSFKKSGFLLWGMDANSKSEVWYSPITDGRGSKLTEFISMHHLFVMNEDCGPTFCSQQGSSYIDVTVCGLDLLQYVTNWDISDNDSLSDHRMISFEMDFSSIAVQINSDFPGFNTKRANWSIFNELCQLEFSDLNELLDSCHSKSSLQGIVNKFNSMLFNVTRKAIPPRKGGIHKVPWWSSEINCMRKQVNAARRRYQRQKNENIRNIYKSKYMALRQNYNTKLAEAKFNSWKTFLSEISYQNVWSKICSHDIKITS